MLPGQKNYKSVEVDNIRVHEQRRLFLIKRTIYQPIQKDHPEGTLKLNILICTKTDLRKTI